MRDNDSHNKIDDKRAGTSDDKHAGVSSNKCVGVSKKKLVVKIGSSTLVDEACKIKRDWLDAFASQVAHMRSLGWQVVVVSSGAIACGMRVLNVSERPSELASLQAAASIGQSAFGAAWAEAFGAFDIVTGNVLLTRRDTADRTSYLHARDTLNRLLELGVVPVVNENDTVSVEQIKFGDNDTLAALVACVIDADACVILSDIEGLFDKNPATCADAKLVEVVERITPDVMASATSSGSSVGSGGMVTKLNAARVLMAAGIPLVVAHGDKVVQRDVSREGQDTNRSEQKTNTTEWGTNRAGQNTNRAEEKINCVDQETNRADRNANKCFFERILGELGDGQVCEQAGGRAGEQVGERECDQNSEQSSDQTRENSNTRNPIGTFFVPHKDAHEITPKKLWVALGSSTQGTLTIDAGAQKALQNKGSSLLSVGIKVVCGTFEAGDVVDVKNEIGDVIARGRAEFSSDEIALACGRTSAELSSNRLLAPLSQRPVVHRDELMVF